MIFALLSAEVSLKINSKSAENHNDKIFEAYITFFILNELYFSSPKITKKILNFSLSGNNSSDWLKLNTYLKDKTWQKWVIYIHTVFNDLI